MIKVDLIQAPASNRQSALVKKWYSTSFNYKPERRLIAKRRGLARRLADNAFYKPVHAQHLAVFHALAVFQELNTVLARHRTAEYVHLTRNNHAPAFR